MWGREEERGQRGSCYAALSLFSGVLIPRPIRGRGSTCFGKPRCFQRCSWYDRWTHPGSLLIPYTGLGLEMGRTSRNRHDDDDGGLILFFLLRSFHQETHHSTDCRVVVCKGCIYEMSATAYVRLCRSLQPTLCRSTAVVKSVLCRAPAVELSVPWDGMLWKCLSECAGLHIQLSKAHIISMLS